MWSQAPSPPMKYLWQRHGTVAKGARQGRTDGRRQHRLSPWCAASCGCRQYMCERLGSRGMCAHVCSQKCALSERSPVRPNHREREFINCARTRISSGRTVQLYYSCSTRIELLSSSPSSSFSSLASASCAVIQPPPTPKQLMPAPWPGLQPRLQPFLSCLAFLLAVLELSGSLFLTAGVACCCCWRRSRRQRRTGFWTPTIPQLSWSKKHKRCSSMDSSFIVSPSFFAMS